MAVKDIAIFNDNEVRPCRPSTSAWLESGSHTRSGPDPIGTPDSIYTLTSNEIVCSETGKYLVFYEVSTTATGAAGSNRRALNCRITNNGVASEFGLSSNYCRESGSSYDSTCSAMAIMDVTSGNGIAIQAERRDTQSPTAHNIDTIIDGCSIQVLRLKDDDNYGFYTGSVASTAIAENTESSYPIDPDVDLSWTTLQIDTEEEGDTGFSLSSNTVTCPKKKLLVLYGVHCSSAGNRGEMLTRVLLEGGEILESYSSCYLRNSSGITDGWAHGSFVVDASGATDAELTIQACSEQESTSANLEYDETYIQIIELPDAMDFAHFRTSADVTSFTQTPVAHDYATEVELDTGSFGHPTNSEMRMENAEDYLFLGGYYCSRDAIDTARQTLEGRWYIDGADTNLGRFDQFNRGDQSSTSTTTCAKSHGFIAQDASVDEDVEIRYLTHETAADDNVIFPATYSWIQGLNLDTWLVAGATTHEGATSLTGTGTIAAAGTVVGPFEVTLSSNIATSGEDTTAQLTAPSGKSSGSDFDTGRAWDDENGTDSIDITEADYTELEFCMQATEYAEEIAYRFRIVLNDGTVLDTYTVNPQITVGGAEELGATSLTGTGTLAAAGVVERAADAALTGTATLAAVASVDKTGVIAISGVATLAVVADIDKTGVTSLVGTGSLTVAAVVERGGVTALVGTATLDAAGVRDLGGVTSLTGTATLTVLSSPDVPAVVLLAGPATLVALPTLEITGAVALVGTATLAAVGDVDRAGVTSLVGTATLTASAVADRSGATSLTGTGTLTVLSSPDVPAIVSLTGIATLTAVAEITAEVQGNAALTGTATLAASGAVERNAATSLTGVATLAALGVGDFAAVILISGPATLAAVASVDKTGVVSLTGTATLLALSSPDVPATVSLTGTATLTALSSADVPALVSLTGTATLTALSSPDVPALVSLTGTATLAAAAEVSRDEFGATSLTGIGTLAVSAFADRAGVLSITGSASLAASGSVEHTGVVSLTGTATITPLCSVDVPAAVSLTGTATLAADAELIKGDILGVTNLFGQGDVDADPTVEYVGSAALLAAGTLSAQASVLKGSWVVGAEGSETWTEDPEGSEEWEVDPEGSEVWAVQDEETGDWVEQSETTNNWGES